MRKIVLTLLCLIAPSIARAYEMRLGWNECSGAGAPHTMMFACNTNSNTESRSLVVSFIPPAGITSYCGNQVTLDIFFNEVMTPSWWAVKGTGQCRNNAAIGSADFASGPFGCADVWQGQAVGGIASYNIAFVTPNRARMQLVFAVQTALAQPLDENLEYYACKVTILNNKTVGTGSCTGCATPAGIIVSNIVLNQLAGAGDPQLGGVLTLDSVAGWQCPASLSICDGPGCGPVVISDCTTPARKTTWGMIKAIYH